MNVLPAHLIKMGRTLLAVMALCCVLPSCDSAIYDDEGDCEVTYRLKFRYDRNMKWSDAFAQEVSSVHLYAFDSKGTLVWQQTESGPALAADDYAMTLDIPAGDYSLVAWCGLDNDNTGGKFTVTEAKVGETRLEDLLCRLDRNHDADGAFCADRLNPLFHGILEVTLPTNDDGGDYTFCMDLTKDTNHIRIIMQHLSGQEISDKDFIFRIHEANGLMAYDNSLLPDESISYRPYHTGSATAGMGIDDYPTLNGAQHTAATRATVTSVSVAMADISIPRLMEDRRTYLTIVARDDGHTVASIPLTDYALLLKDGYEREMTPQDYLDRQDEYALVFFLDENDLWIRTSIIINSWRVVLNNINFK